VTRPVRFDGAHLFVNADLQGGDLRVELLDESGRTIEPFTRERCAAITGNSTRLAVTWPQSMASLAGKTVRLKFFMTRGRLFSFWISPWPSGESRGFVAAGGPGFTRTVDSRDR